MSRHVGDRLFPVVLCLLMACRVSPSTPFGESNDGAADSADPASEEGTATVVGASPIVVFWFIDTLSEAVATDGDWCERLQTIAGRHGGRFDCRSGGVSPSSWTGESHLRTLWPEAMSAPLSGELWAPCDKASAPRTIAEATGGGYFIGMDNPMLDQVIGTSECSDGQSGWVQGADRWSVSPVETDLSDLLVMPERERPWWVAVDALLASTATGAPGVAVLNDFEAGGHSPHCWFDPGAPLCVELWEIAVEALLVSPDADPAVAFADPALWVSLHPFLVERWGDGEALRERELALQQMGSDWFRLRRTEERLVALFAALEDQGRLNDLVLIITADHGESPCIPSALSDSLDCGHGGLPSEWTTQVPTFIWPEAEGKRWAEQGWVGDGVHPWSTSNLAWAATRAAGVEVPESWGEPTPVGQAASWTCWSGALSRVVPSGVAISGDRSLRCIGERCATFDWTAVRDVGDHAMAVDDLPDELVGWVTGGTGTRNGVEERCGPGRSEP